MSSLLEICNAYASRVEPNFLESYCWSIVEKTTVFMKHSTLFDEQSSNEEVLKQVLFEIQHSMNVVEAENRYVDAIPQMAFLLECEEIAKNDPDLQLQIVIETKKRFEIMNNNIGSDPVVTFDPDLKIEKRNGNLYLVLNGLRDVETNSPIYNSYVEIFWKSRLQSVWGLERLMRMESLTVKFNRYRSRYQVFVVKISFHMICGKYEKEFEIEIKSNFTPYRPSEPTECPICYESFRGEHRLFHITRCGHMFCTPCLRSWLRQSNSCPYCRQTLD